jgi:hypothetical protein
MTKVYNAKSAVKLILFRAFENDKVCLFSPDGSFLLPNVFALYQKKKRGVKGVK